METHPHANRALGESLQGHSRRRRCSPRSREGEEERISLCIDLDSTVGGDRTAQYPPVLREGLRVTSGAEAVQ